MSPGLVATQVCATSSSKKKTNPETNRRLSMFTHLSPRAKQRLAGASNANFRCLSTDELWPARRRQQKSINVRRAANEPSGGTKMMDVVIFRCSIFARAENSSNSASSSQFRCPVSCVSPARELTNKRRRRRRSGSFLSSAKSFHTLVIGACGDAEMISANGIRPERPILNVESPSRGRPFIVYWHPKSIKSERASLTLSASCSDL